MLHDSASFRDPSGFVFEHGQDIYRAIAPSYFSNYDLLESSGLYKRLTEREQLVSHSVMSEKAMGISERFPEYNVIKPAKIPFISYPYEWSFGQLKSAALLTMSIQSESLRHGMSLKDASAFNVQFIGSAPIFIDTLSFEKYNEGTPWIAYGQFCRHFLAPLSLMAYRSVSLSAFSRLFLDGIPLELANTLLPRRALLNSVVLSHINIHSRFLAPKKETKSLGKSSASLSKNKLLAIIQHLEDGIRNLNAKKSKSIWSNYQHIDNYSNEAKEKKHNLIEDWIKKIKPGMVWDLGCNTGEYSFIASKYSTQVVAMDSDPLCIEELFVKTTIEKSRNILPLMVDITNPTPAIGWENLERKNIFTRGKADLLLALALVHHLRIGNNTPWEKIAKLFSNNCTQAIVEFVPKEDSQIAIMLQERTDIFRDINRSDFENSFKQYFDILETAALADSGRILYLMKSKAL